LKSTTHKSAKLALETAPIALTRQIQRTIIAVADVPETCA